MDNWTRGATGFQEHERTVRRAFWAKLKHFAGQMPFVEDLVAAYYCALDPATPMQVRGKLLAALAYFVVRWRYRPLTWLWRFPGLGFTNDAAVLTAVFGLLLAHYACAPRSSGESARQGGAQKLRSARNLLFNSSRRPRAMWAMLLINRSESLAAAPWC